MIEYIWLDDLHHPNVSGFPLKGEGVWLKNSQEFFATIEQIIESNNDNHVRLVSFDNDLGEGSLEGYDCFNALEEHLYNGRFKNLDTIIVHSDNTSRVTAMLSSKVIFKEKYGITILRIRRNV